MEEGRLAHIRECARVGIDYRMPQVAGHRRELLAEVDRLRAQVAELEAEVEEFKRDY